MADLPSLGHLIDGLDFAHGPAEREEVLGAVVLLKVRDAEGGVGLRSLWSDDLDWLERLGMHTVAAQAELPADAPDEDTWLDEERGFPPLHGVDTGPGAGDSRPGSR